MVTTTKFSQFANAGSMQTGEVAVGLNSGNNAQFQVPLQFLPDFTNATRPLTPPVPSIGFNTDVGLFQFYNGAWLTVGAASLNGIVNPGLANQLGYYVSAGTEISGLTTADNGLLLTNNTGVPFIGTASQGLTQLGVTGNGTAPIGQLPGINNNSNASAGNIGEYVSANLASGSALSLTTLTPANILSISLTAGDWNVNGNVGFIFSTTGFSNYICWASTTSATLPDQSLWSQVPVQSTGASTISLIVPQLRVSVSVTTTVYLSVECAFTGTVSACGNIEARRVR